MKSNHLENSMAVERKKKLCQGECASMQYLFSKGMCKSCWARLHKKPINPISESLKESNKIYKVEKAEYMKEHPICEAGVICKNTAKSEDIHHKKGRLGKLLTDKRYFLAVCRRDHDWIELNPKEAKKLGFSLNRI